jgi:hypothetical protein
MYQYPTDWKLQKLILYKVSLVSREKKKKTIKTTIFYNTKSANSQSLP